MQSTELVDPVPGWLNALVDPVRLHILRSLSELGDATAADLAGHGPTASSQTLRRHLEALVSSGVIEQKPGESDGETAGRPAARFRLQPDVRDSVHAAFKSLSAPRQPSLR